MGYPHIGAVLDAPAFGLPYYKAMTDFNYANLQGIGKAFPGMVFHYRGGLFQVVQNRSGGDLTAGMAVSLYFSNANRDGGLATGATVAVALTDDTLDANLAGDDQNPSFIAVTAGAKATTAVMQRRIILANSVAAGASTVTVAKVHPEEGPSATALTSEEAFTGVPDNTWKYSVFCPWEVVKSDIGGLGTSITQGIVVSTTITNAYFGIIQVGGTCLANVDGTTDLVTGDLLIPFSTAGSLAKWVVTNLDPTIAQVNQALYVCARVLDAYTADSVGTRHIQLLNAHLRLIPYI
jgi:hypothetical protein